MAQVIEPQPHVQIETTTTAAPTTTPPQPSRKIPVQQYQPKVQDFVTNVDSVHIQAIPLRKTEPAICGKMRAFIDSQVKPVYEMVLSDVKRIESSLGASRSSNIENIAFDARNAIQRVYGELSDTTNSALTWINGNCSALNTIIVLNNTIQGLEDWRQTQIAQAGKLIAIPHNYEAIMQGNYAKIEKVIGTNF